MIEIKLKTLVESDRALSEITNLKGLDAKVQWNLSKMLKKYQEEMKDFFNARKDILGEYSKETDMNNIPAELIAKVDDLLDVSLELSIKTLTYSDFCQEINKKAICLISSASLAALDWLIKE